MTFGDSCDILFTRRAFNPCSCKYFAVLLGSNVKALATELGEYGADKVIVVDLSLIHICYIYYNCRCIKKSRL